ncbi:OmpA family protein [Shivajiella indica]|uniref:OmpA family protein n=1 Tax=Shivajiella indica TaxID=872115 RepID=A0ABW5B5P0_9BACT
MLIFKASSTYLLAFCVFLSTKGQQQISPMNALNSPFDEQHAVMSPNGEIFFSVGFHPQNTGGPADYGDIWMSSKNQKGQWNKPIQLKELSTPGNDVVVGFPDPITILVYHSGDGRKQGIHQYSKFGKSWNYVRQLDLGNFINSSTHFSGRLSYDGNVIIMSIKTFGSYGNEDIYVSFKKSEGIWSSPKNIGNTINSFAQEQTPFLSEDQKILYFSSNASVDKSGKNIFFSRRLDDSWERWSNPRPLASANSIGSELGFANIFKEENLAIFSTTINSEGMGDFMLLGYQPEEVLIDEAEEIVLFQEDEIKEHKPLYDSALVKVADEEIMKEQAAVLEDEIKEEGNQTLAQEQTVGLDSLKTQAEAVKIEAEQKVVEEKILLEKPVEAVNPIAKSEPEKLEEPVVMPIASMVKKPERDSELSHIQILDVKSKKAVPYKITITNAGSITKELSDQQEMQEEWEKWDWNNILISAKGYIPATLSVDDWNSLKDNTLYLIPAVSGASLVLKNIQFAKGTAEFEDAMSIQVLDQLVHFMMENEKIKIRLEGHTDNAGDPGLNKDLSLKRASKIRAYLTVKGIGFERIRISGWGGTRPIADNSTEEGRELNRRVEMYIEK